MSLLNAWIAPAEAIVAVDTDGVGPDGSRMPSSKLLPLPHLNAVMALRGQYAFLSFVFLRCLSSAFNSFDEMDDALLDLLREADDFLPTEHIVKDCRIGNELVVIGWSDRRARMVGRQYVKRDAMIDFEAADVDHHISPWHHSMQGIPITPGAIDRIAQAQVRWMRETFPDAACGGNLLVCRLTQKSMELRNAFTFQADEMMA